MSYTPPDRHALTFELGGGYTPPDRHAVEFDLPPGANSIDTAQGQSAAGTAVVGVIGAITTGQVQGADAAATQSFTGAVDSAQGQSVGGDGRMVIPRHVSSQVSGRWTRGTTADHELQSPLGIGARRDQALRAALSVGEAVDAVLTAPWGAPAPRDTERDIILSPGAVLDAEPVRGRWRNPPPHDLQRQIPLVDAAPRDTLSTQARWRNPPAHDVERAAAWSKAVPLDHELLAQAGSSTAADTERRVPWGQGDAVPWVWLPTPPVHPEPPLPPPCYIPPNRHALLFDLGDRGAAYLPPDRHDLEFGLRCGDGRRFDLRQTLVMSHSLSVVRLPDRLPLRVRSVSMDIDRDSWCWSVRLSFADASSAIAVEPTPEGNQSVEITLDGYVWTALVEGYTEDRAFNQRTISATGRSRSALLASPAFPARAYTNPAPATAQQLALRELDFTDFALDWDADDWTVLTGAWSYSADTPISAISKIAAAAGYMLQSARDSDTLIVGRRLPAAPWALGGETPDFTLAGGSWLRKGKRYGSGAGYKGAVVSGENQGVTVIVYRDGTSGSPYAPQVIDPLITETVPGISRGTAIVADSLPRHEIPVELPLMPAPLAPGLLMPGELGEIEDTVWGLYRAVVDSVSISAEVSAEGLLTARQNATLWRYLV